MKKHAIKLQRITTTVFYRFRSMFSRWGRYTITCIGIHAMIASIAIASLIALPRNYVSHWTMILPGAGVSSKIDIDSIGSASAVVNSAFSSRSLSPKANYKSIAQSSIVLKQAANKVGLTKGQFGKPQIKLVDQTSLMYFSMSASTPQTAQRKAWALFDSLHNQITKLRLDEMARREQGVQAMLGGANEKLNSAKQALIDFQSQSDIVTAEQFERIPLLIEELRAQRSALAIETEQVQAELQTLSKTIGITSNEAADIMTLHADPYFQELAEQNSVARATLSQFTGKLGANHFKVREQKLDVQSSHQSMSQRARRLTGNSKLIDKMTLSGSGKQTVLFYDLIALQTKHAGLERKLTQLDTQIAAHQQRLKKHTNNAGKLDELRRTLQIAEAVFSSAVAKVDTGKSDIFASYPMLQMMMPPTMPEKTSGAQPWHIYLGSAFGSFMTLVTLSILWFRRKHLSQQQEGAPWQL